MLDFSKIYEDDQVVFVDKPAGLLVHRGKGTKELTLADLLIQKFPYLQSIGEDPLRPGIVHRLDKDTSGVMVIAKTQKSFEELKNLWKQRKVEKIYLAVVHGRGLPEAGTMESFIRRSRSTGRMVAEKKGMGKQAITAYEVLETRPHYSLVKILPRTGRMHQIRSQFAGLGHSVVGDPWYRPRKMKTRHFPRLMLHAWRLRFCLEEKAYDIQCPIPEDFVKTSLELGFSLENFLEESKR